MSEPESPAPPRASPVADARDYLHRVAIIWPDRAVLLAARLLRLGLPGEVVASNPSPVDTEEGDVPGASWSTALRPGTSVTARACEAVDAAWRAVAMAAGRPLRGPHEVSRGKGGERSGG